MIIQLAHAGRQTWRICDRIRQAVIAPDHSLRALLAATNLNENWLRIGNSPRLAHEFPPCGDGTAVTTSGRKTRP